MRADPAGVVAHACRDDSPQARPAGRLGSPLRQVRARDDHHARAAGQVGGVANTGGIVDASVAVAARNRGARVFTSDPDDLRRLPHHIDVVAL
jgi:predicted nucleic acid-binding protein